MKIRTDFVTNSSSSSFILAFTSEETMKQELVNGYPDHYERLGTVMRDVTEANRMTPEQVLEEVAEEKRWGVEWRVEERYERDGHSYREARDYVENGDGKKKVDDLMEEMLAELRESMKGNNVFVEVEYSDHDNYDLEQEIMPEVDSVIAIINNH